MKDFKSFDPARYIHDSDHPLYTTNPDRLQVAVKSSIGWMIVFLTPAEIRQQASQGNKVQYPAKDTE